MLKQLLAEGAAKNIVLRETPEGFICECTVPWSEEPYLLQAQSGRSRRWKNVTRFIEYSKKHFPNLNSVTVIFNLEGTDV